METTQNTIKALEEESDEQYYLLLEYITDSVQIIDPDLRYIMVNNAFAHFVRMSKEQLIGSKMTDLFPDIEETFFFKTYKKVLETGESTTVSDELTFPDGRKTWYEARVYPYQQNILVIVTDISEYKKSEITLKKNEKKFRSLVELAPDGIITMDMHGVITSINSAFSNLTGFPENEIIGKHFLKLKTLRVRDLPKYLKLFSSFIFGKKKVKYEFIYIQKDGTQCLGEAHASLLKENGKNIGFISILRDITERKKTQEELQKLALVVKHSSELINLTTLDGKIIFLNEAGCKMLGIAPDEIEQHTILEIIPDNLKKRTTNEVIPALMTKGSWEGEYKYQNIKTGKLIDVYATCFTINDSHLGKPLYLANVSHDITEQKRMAEELRRKENLKMMGMLAGGVGHELRNSLGVIKNASYFLNMILKDPEPDAKETLEILENEVATSEKIISTLLDFARPKLPIKHKIPIHEIINKVLSHINIPKNIEVLNQVDDKSPMIVADPDQLDQVFTNLITNAVQAMPDGGQLTINSKINRKWVETSITDTGIGILEENLTNIFKPLFTTKAKGIGLGLAIIKTLVDGHRGIIQVQSQVGMGSTFTVKLPISKTMVN